MEGLAQPRSESLEAPPTRAATATILVLSDIHYASEAEQARAGYEVQAAPNRFVRGLARAYYRRVWKRDPFAHNHLVDAFLKAAGSPDLVVANGDYSCDSAFVGVSDPAACASAELCLGKLRHAFGARFHATIGDHELGKVSLVGGVGGLRLASWDRALGRLKLVPFWRHDLGRYTLIGVTSSLLALPVYEPETLPEERERWRWLRREQQQWIAATFRQLAPDRRVILFCHDPSALPFLARDPEANERLGQIGLTVIGHLHTHLVLWKSRWLAGMPPIRFLGNAVRRMSTALHEARHWRPFHVRLCPALSGVELLQDGGYARLEIDLDARQPPRYEVIRFPKARRTPPTGLERD
jgi:hypothetical protein